MNQINKLKENTICIICAKSNSEGVSSKNIKKINGYPLINYAFKKIKTNNFKFICVSTQSDKVVKLAKENNIKVFFKRSEVLCKKNVSKLLVWKDAIRKSEKYFKKKFKYMIDIEVTNPLINGNDVSKFIKSFYKKKNKYDGQFCITDAKKNPYFNLMEKKKSKFFVSKKTNAGLITARQNAPKVYEHVAGLYYFNCNYILKSKNLFQGKICGFKVPMLKSFDIDTNEDFKLVEILLKVK